MRIVTYNIHGCAGMDGKISPERIASVLERLNADIIGLQEVDVGRKRSGEADQAKVIARQLSMEHHFHPACRVTEGAYGDAILSRHPMKVIKSGALPSVRRPIINETRGALWVSVRVGAVEVQAINTHLGLGRAERRVQAQTLLGEEWLGAASAQGPVILLGDFNSHSGRVVHGMFSERLRDAQAAVRSGRVASTFPTTLPFLCLDHVFLSEEFVIYKAEVFRTPLSRMASDHFPVMVEAVVRG